ncbi:phage tail tip lysozyme [uncultured Paraglaciecola sp.]|uniref:phage tail tip lysozyme n=1 Tax=uncultured Paraglaciecola sp. TaxID=1765024 RepID=UPI00262E87FE|nr:phage tail tip lysozyme [uncultured Paraglaciecola sp.]
MNVGDFFVRLGVKSDNRNLKEFNSELRDGLRTALKFTAVVGGVGFLKRMTDASAKAAVNINNISTRLGVATDRAQKFASVANTLNPNLSIENALSIYENTARYAGMLPYNGAGKGAFFGIDAGDNSAEKVMAKLRKNFDRVEAQYGRVFAVDAVKEIMGTDQALNMLLATNKEINDASKNGMFSPEALQNLEAYARELNVIDNKFTALKGNLLSTPAGIFAKFLKEWNDEVERGGGLKGFLSSVGAMTDRIGEWNPYGLGGDSGSDMPKTDNVTGKMPKNVKPHQRQDYARRFFKSMGWTDAQAAGMVKRLAIESYSHLDHQAVGDGGLAYGIAQWHPDRQRNFAKWSGKDIRNSSFEEQLRFVNYELTKGQERSAGSLLKKTVNADEAYAVFTNKYERPAAEHRAPQQIIQNIHARGDAKAVADEVVRATQQTNIGAAY